MSTVLRRTHRRAAGVTSGLTAPQLDAESFRALVRLVVESCGIEMSDLKHTMLETRLRRRLYANGLASFRDYVALLRSPAGRARELQAFTDCVVTNQTSFFREPPHFEHLTPEALRELAAGGKENALDIWSAASSSGEEAYSLAMVANEAAQGGRLFSWSVLATDISIRMLSAVRDGVYRPEDVRSVPERLRRKYLLPAPGGGSGGVRIVGELRKNVRLGRINLMHEHYMPGRTMDVIFCRNVLIYFKTDVQVEVVRKLCRHLRPGGLLFLGHSEALHAPQLPLRLLRRNIYLRLEE